MELYPVVLAGRPCVQVKSEPPRWLSVSRDNWPILLELGMTFGWQAAGTTVDMDRAEHCGPHAPDYEVAFAECAKCVTADDARHWADALAAALCAEGSPSQRQGVRAL